TLRVDGDAACGADVGRDLAEVGAAGAVRIRARRTGKPSIRREPHDQLAVRRPEALVARVGGEENAVRREGAAERLPKVVVRGGGVAHLLAAGRGHAPR